MLYIVTVTIFKDFLIVTNTSHWLAMPLGAGLGAGIPYNREKNESLVCTPPPAYIPLC